MRKEVIFAIVIGFTLGLVITFGIWTANKAIKQAQTEQPSSETEQIPETPAPTPQEITLTITSPENNDLVSTENIEVSGKTSPGAIVVVIYQGGERVVEAEANGNFSAKIALVAGANEITVTAIDEEDNEASKTLNLVYSTAEI